MSLLVTLPALEWWHRCWDLIGWLECLYTPFGTCFDKGVCLVHAHRWTKYALARLLDTSISIKHVYTLCLFLLCIHRYSVPRIF